MKLLHSNVFCCYLWACLCFVQILAYNRDGDPSLFRHSKDYDYILHQKTEIRHLQERLKTLREEHRDEEADAVNDAIKEKMDNLLESISSEHDLPRGARRSQAPRYTSYKYPMEGDIVEDSTRSMDLRDATERHKELVAMRTAKFTDRIKQANFEVDEEQRLIKEVHDIAALEHRVISSREKDRKGKDEFRKSATREKIDQLKVDMQARRKAEMTWMEESRNRRKQVEDRIQQRIDEQEEL